MFVEAQITRLADKEAGTNKWANSEKWGVWMKNPFETNIAFILSYCWSTSSSCWVVKRDIVLLYPLFMVHESPSFPHDTLLLLLWPLSPLWLVKTGSLMLKHWNGITNLAPTGFPPSCRPCSCHCSCSPGLADLWPGGRSNEDFNDYRDFFFSHSVHGAIWIGAWLIYR